MKGMLRRSRPIAHRPRPSTWTKDEPMASFRGHLATAAGLGVVYGAAGYWRLGIEPIFAAIAAGLTTVGGLLPDLDSDSSVPNRMLFRLAAVGTALLALRHL